MQLNALYSRVSALWLFTSHFPYALALCLCLSFCCFALLADLAKAMATPMPGEMPSTTGLDLAQVGLGAALGHLFWQGMQGLRTLAKPVAKV